MEDSRLWDTWRHRTQGSAAAPTRGRGGSGPLPERGAEVPRLAPGWLDDSGLLEVRLPLVEAQVRPAEVRDLSARVRPVVAAPERLRPCLVGEGTPI